MTVYGFTGTRYQPSDSQCQFIARHVCQDRVVAVRHGVCVGSDAVFHRLALLLNSQAHIYLHPPIKTQWLDTESLERSRGQEFATVLAAKPYHERNRDIVNNSEMLLATPRLPECDDNLYSGTWMTVNYARSIDRPVLICLPSGKVLAE